MIKVKPVNHLRAEVTLKTIALQFPFDRQMGKEVKALGGLWHEQARIWTMPASFEGIDYLIEKKFDFTDSSLDIIPQILAQLEEDDGLRQVRRAWSTALHADPIQEVVNQITTDLVLAPFQWVPCYYSRLTDCQFLLSDPQGSGKTIEATAVTLLPENLKYPVLITAPANAVYNWQNELMTMFGFKSHVITKPLTQLMPGIRYYIVSYNMADRMQLKEELFLIADESAEVKNKRAQRTKKILAISLQCPKKICMSGTPTPNRPVEAWTQLNILKPGFMTYEAFTNRYCAAHFDQYGRGKNVLGHSNLGELHKLLFENYLVRREKDQILPQLPKKLRQIVTLDNKLVEGESLMEMYANNALMKSCDPDFKEWLIGLFDRVLDEDKVLLFYHHKILGKTLQEWCNELGIKYIVIDGSTPKETRAQLVRKFQTDPSYKVAILSIMAASTAITLTAACISVFCEIVFSPGTHSQAEDRIHRMGQQKTCLILYPFISRLEDRMWAMNLAKMLVTEKIYKGAGIDGESDRSIMTRIASEFNVPINKRKEKEADNVIPITAKQTSKFLQ